MRMLSDRDTLGAIDLLVDWSDQHGESVAVSDLLDRLQLPDKSPPPSSAPAATPPPPPRPWSLLVEGDFHVDSTSPIQGEVNLQRRLFLGDSGRNAVAVGLTAGSWTEDAAPYATADAWLGWRARHPAWSAKMTTWFGWTEENHPELGASGQWQHLSKHGLWQVSHGPSARLSWRRTRLVGWSIDMEGAAARSRLELGGGLWLRQDPAWPAVRDTLNDKVPWRLARVRIQSTLDADFLLPRGNFAFGPGFDLDARTCLLRDRWTDQSTAVHHTLRSDLAATAKLISRWNPSRSRIVQFDAGWTWTAESGEAIRGMSPFYDGLAAGARCLSDF